MFVRVAIAQINPTVGDLAGNVRLIVKACEDAVAQGADVVVTPELALTGYPPEDLLLRPAFYVAAAHALETLARELAQWPDVHVVVGHPERVVRDAGSVAYNSASVLAAGRVCATYRKQALPNYQVFDELRYFSPGDTPCVFDVKGVRFGVAICEDIWFPEVPRQSRAAGAQVLLVPNGSPYHIDKGQHRIEIVRERVAETGLAIVYANLVGGQDELQFDGDSFVVDASGVEQLRLPHCETAIGLLDVEWIGHGSHGRLQVQRSTLAPVLEREEAVYRVLVQGVRDYIEKNGFPGAIIGLSGGVDSALTLAIAVDAIGADRVRAVMMPSPYTADISWIDSREMVKRLGVQYDEISITPVFDAFRAQLAEQFAGLPEDATEENIQARTRGTLLMALSNKTGRIVLTTGNKSEMATGYCTLYGDMAGGYAVIKDIFKTLVYRLCRWRNSREEVIPERILVRPPSAELRPDQTDQDSLPPYEVLDAILKLYMEDDEPIAHILQRGYDRATVEKVVRLLQINEYKRRQAPVGVRVTQRGFGRDWRYPITNRFRET